jgi:GNAT superfamily N-acetyltransferase
VRTYSEPARSYRGLWLLVALLLVLFLIDVGLGSAVAHLPGWLIASALVLGIGAFVVHAARVSHSLTLSEDELRIGDEAIGRDDIAAVTPGVDAELPVLGWRTGLPAGSKGVIVRLSDDTAVVVPCRYPDRLVAALGVGSGDGPEVRPAEPADLEQLAEIDERADTLFRMAGYDLPELPFDAEGVRAAKAVFVVGQPPVGYVQVDEVDGAAHVAQLAVLPGAMRQGLGTRLLDRACEWAREQGYDAVTLTTYADVPWNGRYYRVRGFAEIETDDVTPGLSARREWERSVGLDGVGRRIVMRRALAPVRPA